MQVATTQFLKYMGLAYQSASSCDVKDRIIWNTYKTLLEPMLGRDKIQVLDDLNICCVRASNDNIFPGINEKHTLFVQRLYWRREDLWDGYSDCAMMPHPFDDTDTFKIRVFYERPYITPLNTVPEEHREWFSKYVSELPKNTENVIASINHTNYKLSPEIQNILRLHSIHMLHVKHIAQ